MSAFVDTSAFYAYLVASQERHADVRREFRRLVEAGRSLHTTSYVVVETAALLQHRIGLDPVRDFVAHVLPLVSVEWVTERLHRDGMERLMRESRRRPSLVDCVGVEAMHARGLRDVLALDRHFAEAGFRLLPA